MPARRHPAGGAETFAPRPFALNRVPFSPRISSRSCKTARPRRSRLCGMEETMDGSKRAERRDDPAADLVLATELVMARGSLSPLEIAVGSREGRIELPEGEGGRMLLEAGGTAIAEGRVVRKGGRHFFKITRLFGPGVVA